MDETHRKRISLRYVDGDLSDNRTKLIFVATASQKKNVRVTVNQRHFNSSLDAAPSDITFNGNRNKKEQ